MQVRECGWVLPFAILFARHHIRVGVFGLVLVAHLDGLAPLSGGAIFWTNPNWKCVYRRRFRAWVCSINSLSFDT